MRQLILTSQPDRSRVRDARVYAIEPLKPLLSPAQQLRSETDTVARCYAKRQRKAAKRLRELERIIPVGDAA